jgi:hypothetical protein
MHALKTAYSAYYNLRYHRHGHLFDGRYKAKLVEGDAYLLTLSRYVHLNPVWVGEIRKRPAAERIKTINAYRWSSYRSYIARGKPYPFVEQSPILCEMKGRRREWPGRYQSFVEDAVAEADSEFMVSKSASSRCIGTDSFRKWIDGLYEELAERNGSTEDVSFRKFLSRLPPEAVTETVCKGCGVPEDDLMGQKRGAVLRGIGGSMLCRHSGLTQREAAAILGLGTGAAISQQISRLRARMVDDRRLRRRVERLDSDLRAMRIGTRTQN